MAVPGFTPIAVVVAMIVVAGVARHNAAVPRHMCAHIGPVIRAVVRVIPAVGPVAAVGRPFRRHDHAPEQGGHRLVSPRRGGLRMPLRLSSRAEYYVYCMALLHHAVILKSTRAAGPELDRCRGSGVPRAGLTAGPDRIRSAMSGSCRHPVRRTSKLCASRYARSAHHGRTKAALHVVPAIRHARKRDGPAAAAQAAMDERAFRA